MANKDSYSRDLNPAVLDRLGSNVELLPEYDASSHSLLEQILIWLDEYEGGSTQDQYLQALNRAFASSSCLYIRDSETVFDEQGAMLSVRETRELCRTYGFLFRQKMSISFKRAYEAEFASSIYVPLDIKVSVDPEEFCGLLFCDSGLTEGADQSLNLVLSSIYLISDRFTAKASQNETKICIFDSLGKSSAYPG